MVAPGNLGRTGRVSFGPLTADVQRTDSVAHQQVCEYTYRGHLSTPPPVTLLVAALQPGFSNNGHPFSHLSASCNLSGYFTGKNAVQIACSRSGALELEYGAGSFRRTIVADLRGGSYQLPPVEWARLTAYYFLPNHTSNWSGMDVAATFAEGAHHAPARFTASAMIPVPPAEWAGGLIPQGARWVSVEGGHYAAPLEGTYPVSPGAVRFLEESGGDLGHGVYIVHDDVTQTHVPSSQPVELGARSVGFTVFNDHAIQTRTVGVRFFLEL